MEKKQEYSLSKKKKVVKELLNTSYDTEDCTVESLMKLGFTNEQEPAGLGRFIWKSYSIKEFSLCVKLS